MSSWLLVYFYTALYGISAPFFPFFLNLIYWDLIWKCDLSLSWNIFFVLGKLEHSEKTWGQDDSAQNILSPDWLTTTSDYLLLIKLTEDWC